MAKQRPKPTKTQSRPSPDRPSRQLGQSPSAAAPARQATTPAAPAAPVRRTTYFEAVAVYERGLEALQRHDYPKASNLFESVLRQFPEEKELHERVRQYLSICQRQASTQETSPRTLDERIYAATLAINGGHYDQALQHLRLVRDEEPDNDHALYMLAVAHAQRGDLTEALAHLERAIAMNSENRALARTDPDLDPLRDDEAFRLALEAPPNPPRADRRRPIRTKSAR